MERGGSPPIPMQGGFGKAEWVASISCLAKAGGASIPPASGISRLSRELGLYPHSESTRQWELVPHFHWEVVSGARAELNFHPIHLQQGSVSQCSAFSKVVLAELREA